MTPAKENVGREAKDQACTYLLAALPPLFWAGNFLLARLMRDHIPPFQMSFWRWAIAFAILLPFAWKPAYTQKSRLFSELPFLACLGAIGVTAFNCFIYAALRHTTVINAALINSLMPIATFVFALIVLREVLQPQRLIGLTIALTGAIFIVSRGSLPALLDLHLNRGDFLILAGVICWAAYTVLIRWRPTKLPPIVFLAVSSGFGAVFHLPLVGWELVTKGGFSLSTSSVAAIAYFALFPSVLAYIFWNRAVAVLGPSRTGMFMYLMPVFSTVLAIVFLKESFLYYHAIGIVGIVVGVTLVTRSPARA